MHYKLDRTVLVQFDKMTVISHEVCKQEQISELWFLNAAFCLLAQKYRLHSCNSKSWRAATSQGNVKKQSGATNLERQHDSLHAYINFI